MDSNFRFRARGASTGAIEASVFPFLSPTRRPAYQPPVHPDLGERSDGDLAAERRARDAERQRKRADARGRRHETRKEPVSAWLSVCFLPGFVWAAIKPATGAAIKLPSE